MVGARPVRRLRHRHRATEIFPELEPAEGTGATRRRTSTFADTTEEMRAQFMEVLENPDATNPLARLLVYSLNLVLLILAFPVGFAMLILNILGGPNLRTTVHVLALTGVAIALVNTEAGAKLLGLG
jgi:hypothetical protein